MICLKAAQQPLWCKGVLLIPVSAWSCRIESYNNFFRISDRSILALLFIHVSDPPISFVCRYRLYKIKNIMFLWFFLMLRRIFKNAIKFEKYIWYHCLPYWIKTMGKVQKINLFFFKHIQFRCLHIKKLLLWLRMHSFCLRKNLYQANESKKLPSENICRPLSSIGEVHCVIAVIFNLHIVRRGLGIYSISKMH